MDSSKQAQRTVIQFLSAEGVSGTDILYSRMKMCMEVSVCHVVQLSDGVVIFVMDVWVKRTCHDQVKHMWSSLKNQLRHWTPLWGRIVD